MRGLVWFKKDLRAKDNLALHAASLHCRDGIAGIYFIDPEMWKKNRIAASQIHFIFKGLEKLKAILNDLNIPLLIREVRKTAEIAPQLFQICKELHIEKLFFNREWEFNEDQRDQAVSQLLSQKGLALEIYEDQLILPRRQFYDNRESYFKIFTPFKRYWLKQFSLITNTKLLPRPTSQNPSFCASSPLPAIQKDFLTTLDFRLWPAGELAAEKRLKQFVKDHLFYYDVQRDFPALDATSKLSPYLALGMISPRACFHAALKENNFELSSGNQGALTWMSELIWREFYRHLLIAVPRICKNRAFKPETENLPWLHNEKLLQAWKEGKTGFPLVDAAMRQLNTTGWMHNRLRMVVALFLAKNLLLDWRLGEAYFMEQLIDGDFASNNGGWQWSASTGTDSVPYFRIFNPITQSQRFDPEGQFIRRFCPELKAFDNKAIHNPYRFASQLAKQVDYPPPIIDYAASRKRCLEAFKGLKNKG